MNYLLQYAGVPFCLDEASVYRSQPGQGYDKRAPDDDDDIGIMAPRKHQPLADLIEELNRLLPFRYLDEVAPSPGYPGRSLAGAAHEWQPGGPSEADIGDWYYPTGARRWSVFRGLATSSMVKAMLAATLGRYPEAFVMMNEPRSDRPFSSTSAFTLSTQMYMLPPRPLGEHGRKYDGLYLVTLVDERYHWQFKSVTLNPEATPTWGALLSALGTALGVTLSYSAIPAVYGAPEADSPLRCVNERAGVVLDMVCANLGLVCCRLMNGTYALRTAAESDALVKSNRGAYRYIRRVAGGDLFMSGYALPAGDLRRSQEAVLPASIRVSFPRYVYGDDPVPHWSTVKDPQAAGTSWYNEARSDAFVVDVYLTSGGDLSSGKVGVPSTVHTVHSTAKAWCSGELSGASNASGLTALAVKLAGDYWDAQCAGGLDEKYEGTVAWTPEGCHDLIWTWSARSREAALRVMTTHWNTRFQEMQHAGPGLSGYSQAPAGRGGLPVAQSWRDSNASGQYTGGNGVGSSGVACKLFSALNSGDGAATFNVVDFLPTQNRWKAEIEGEVVLFEGTSGGVAGGGGFQVTIAGRGLDGTLQAAHAGGNSVTVLQKSPQMAYGTNLVTFGRGQFVQPGARTSGGVYEAVVVPQVQAVRALSDSPRQIKNINHYSGQVEFYDYTQVSGRSYSGREYVWLVDRGQQPPLSGQRYEGQFVGYAASGPVAPIYLIHRQPSYINVANTAGTKRYSGIDQLIFNEGDGFALSTSGTATRVDFSGAGGANGIQIRETTGGQASFYPVPLLAIQAASDGASASGGGLYLISPSTSTGSGTEAILSIQYATSGQVGIVNKNDQSFRGQKFFRNGIVLFPGSGSNQPALTQAQLTFRETSGESFGRTLYQSVYWTNSGLTCTSVYTTDIVNGPYMTVGSGYQAISLGGGVIGMASTISGLHRFFCYDTGAFGGNPWFGLTASVSGIKVVGGIVVAIGSGA